MRDVHAAIRDVVEAHRAMHAAAHDVALATIAERAAEQARTDADAQLTGPRASDRDY